MHEAGEFGARKSYAIPAAEVLGFAFLLNQVNRHTDGTDFDSNLSTIRRNLHSSWVVDRDPFEVNQLGHPYQGSVYHAFARSAGLDYWESLGYAFAGSALWEIAGERTTPFRSITDCPANPDTRTRDRSIISACRRRHRARMAPKT